MPRGSFITVDIRQKGDAEGFLNYLKSKMFFRNLEKYAQEGVDALKNATPIDTGKTADSWRYEIQDKNGYTSISWINDNVNDGVPIAIILQYGHGTGTGGYVEGIDYINPALRPIFDKISRDVWNEVIESRWKGYVSWRGGAFK